MKLPGEFVQKMRSLLGEQEYNDFEKSFDLARFYGMRVNTLKISAEDFFTISPFKLEKVPWSSDGFYYESGENPGRHPYYHAGLYYIQEPSAMLPAEILGAKPGERVLDLCAAPGGKTVRIAADMKGKGLLVANDINAERIKALIKNIELCGVRNAIVTNADSNTLAKKFPGYFDRILIDAPCSGEGMFRKDEDAVKSWARYKCDTCSAIQHVILDDAAVMLRPGGTIVYSTCTFSPEEDEMAIASFLKRHPEYILQDIPKIAGIESGRPEWAGGCKHISFTARLWPHKVMGEGHFAACMVKAGGDRTPDGSIYDHNQNIEPPAAFKDFCLNNLSFQLQGNFMTIGNNLYLLPEIMPDLSGIKVAKFGWFVGEIKNGKFEPSHSLVMSLNKRDINHAIDFSPGADGLIRYLRGETLIMDGENGYRAVCVDGFTLGWAKQTGGMLKNLYPKGWRRQR